MKDDEISEEEAARRIMLMDQELKRLKSMYRFDSKFFKTCFFCTTTLFVVFVVMPSLVDQVLIGLAAVAFVMLVRLLALFVGMAVRRKRLNFIDWSKSIGEDDE